jgi:inner membrane protein
LGFVNQNSTQNSLEPITHFLFGGVMARAGLNRKSALATATLVLAAEAPDLDVLANLGGRISGFEHHRGITHTFLGVPLMAGVVVLVMYIGFRCFGGRGARAGKPLPRWGTLFWLACLAGLSHILLDFTNSYGVRPFEPFSYRWYSWDIVFIAEPVLWVLLLGGLLLPSLSGLVRGEVRSNRQGKAPRGRVAALTALGLVFVFWGFRDYQHRRAKTELRALTYGGEVPVRVSAYPYYVNPFRWYGIVETSSSYHCLEVNSRIPEVDPADRGRTHLKLEPSPVIMAAERSRLGRVFLDWAQYPVAEAERLDEPSPGFLVRFFDLRFQYPLISRRPLGGWVRLSPTLHVLAESFGWRHLSGNSR